MTIRRLIGLVGLLVLAAPMIVASYTAQQPVEVGPIPPLPTLPPIIGDPFASPTPVPQATAHPRPDASANQSQGWIIILPDGKAMTDHGLVAMGDRYEGSTVVAITPEGIVLANGRTIRPTPQGALPAATVPPLLPPVQPNLPTQQSLPGMQPPMQPGTPVQQPMPLTSPGGP